MTTPKKRLSKKSNSEKKSDSRKNPRKACSESTFYATGDGLYEGLIENIGPKGVFIKTSEPLTVGETITVAVPSSGDTKGSKFKGKIVWKSQSGFGVFFKESPNP